MTGSANGGVSVSTRSSRAAAAAAKAAASAAKAAAAAAKAAAAATMDVVMGGTSSSSSSSSATPRTILSPTAPSFIPSSASSSLTQQTQAPPVTTTIVSASLLATVGTTHGAKRAFDSTGIGMGLDGGQGGEPRARCSQCGRRRTACHHLPHQQGLQQPAGRTGVAGISGSGVVSPLASPPAPVPASLPLASALIGNGALSAAPRPRRISKLRHRAAASSLTGGSGPSSAAGGSAGSGSGSGSASSVASSLSGGGNAAAATVTFATSIDTSSPTPAHASSATDDSSDPSSPAMEPPVLSFYGKEPVPLPTRFAHIKRSLVAGHEAELEASWARLITALRDDVDDIASRGSSLTPSIDFADIHSPDARAAFSRDLKRYGLGLIRGVVPRTDAQVAIDETVKYLDKQDDFKAPPPQDPTCFDFFWTPAQVRTRAHPRVLEAQRFAMSLWDNNADDRMALRFPIAYGDRLRIHGANIGSVGPDAAAASAAAANNKAEGEGEGEGDAASKEDEDSPDGEDDQLDAQKAAAELLGDFASSTLIAQVDNGSLERWEPDGYGRGGTYDAVFKGEWEKYDPWDPTYRVSATPDLYNGYGACSIFRMYQGVVALSTIEPGLIRLLPNPKLATAYFLLRPFFSPKTKPPARRDGPEWEAFLDPSNWALDKEQTTIIHGAVPGHAQRLTELWHPHLHLRRTLVTIPTLQTGDYIVWHPDLAYHITSNNPNLMASRAPTPPPLVEGEEPPAPTRPVSILVYVPAAPLTQTNALYLARQRKTFQRGHPGPDFDSTGSGLGSEATHIGRPTETDIAEVGGPAGLQAMGLAPFDVAPTPPATATAANGEGSGSEAAQAPVGGGSEMEVDGVGSPAPSMTRAEAEVARLANIILFPDRYDFYMAKRNGNGSKRSKVKVERLLNHDDEDKGRGKGKGKAAGAGKS